MKKKATRKGILKGNRKDATIIETLKNDSEKDNMTVKTKIKVFRTNMTIETSQIVRKRQSRSSTQVLVSYWCSI